jgi:tellurium resistance protein TerD
MVKPRDPQLVNPQASTGRTNMDSISLEKGSGLSLSKVQPNLRRVRVGLGWDVRQSPGAPFDLDAVAFMLKDTGGRPQVRRDQDFIFYNQPASPDGAVKHLGDNRTGEGEGDDEVIQIDLSAVPSDISRIRIGVSIHEADSRGQNFGMVNSAFIRVVNDETNEEIARYNLAQQASDAAAMIFGELYRQNGDWKFGATGHPVAGGLMGLAQACGVNVGDAPQQQPEPPKQQGMGESDLAEKQGDSKDWLDFDFKYEERQ